MPRYTDESKEKLRHAVDFGDLVGRYTELQRAGPGRFKALCPFHEERTPSMSVNASEGFFKCFGCGEGGDLFKFVMLKEGLDFTGALEWLADRYGVELEVVEEAPEQARRRKERERLMAVLERTAAFYARYLWEAGEAAGARAYLTERGLDETLLREFRVGFAPSAWDKVLLASRRAGYSEQELYDAGLVQRNAKTGRVYDRFRGRITFPLCDRRGRVLGFGARKMGDGEGPKYINSPDNVVYHKGLHLYAADIARAHAARAQEVILCEGYTDVIALHQVGIRNTVGLMGTALTADQVTELSRLAPSVLLALDADGAGQEAMIKAAKVAEGRGVELRVIPLPPGADPADVVLAEGGTRMRELAGRSVRFVEFHVRRILDQADVSRAEGKDRAVAELAPVMRDVPQGAVRSELLRVISDRVDLDPALVEQMLGSPRAAAVAARPQPVQRPQRPAASAAPRGDDGWPSEADVPHPDDPAAGAMAPTAANDPLALAERRFLAAALAAGSAGEELLSSLDVDTALTVPLHRLAAQRIRAHPDGPARGLDPDDELAPLMAELIVRAADQSGSAAALEAQFAELRLAALERRIRRAQGAGESISELAAEKVRLQRELDAAIARSLDG